MRRTTSSLLLAARHRRGGVRAARLRHSRAASDRRAVQEMGQRIKATKPWVKFGISPFGIWRIASTGRAGSGPADSYAFADAKNPLTTRRSERVTDDAGNTVDQTILRADMWHGNLRVRPLPPLPTFLATHKH